MGWVNRTVGNSFMTYMGFVDYDAYYKNESDSAEIIKSFWTYWGVGADGYVFADSEHKVATVGDGKAISLYVEAATTTANKYTSLGTSSSASVTNVIYSDTAISNYHSGTNYTKNADGDIIKCTDTTMQTGTAKKYELIFDPGIVVESGDIVYMRSVWNSDLAARHTRVPNKGAVMIRAARLGTGGTVEPYNPNYTVSLSRGTGVASVSGAGSYAPGTTVTLGASLDSGYNWSKWTGTYTSSTQAYSFTMPSQAVSMTANATIKTYTVSYNANGGSGAPTSQIKTYGKDLTLTSSTPTTAKSYTITFDSNGGGSVTSVIRACTFSKWNTSANGSGTSYNSGGTYSGNSSTTLYAQWTNPSAGTLPTPTYLGANFLGWYTAKSGGNKVGSTSTISINTTLYARWSYTISYNANDRGQEDAYNDAGEYIISGVPSSQTKTYLTEITLSKSAPKWPGYAFSNWNTQADEKGTIYKPGDTYSTDAPLILYADWYRPIYTIKYDANGGTDAPASTTKYHDKPVVLTADVPTSPSWVISLDPNGGQLSETYVSFNPKFKEWNESPSGSSTGYSSGGTYSANAGGTLYAQYADVSVSGLPTPTRNGYTFDGWYTSNGSQISDGSKLRSSISVEARWTAHVYTIKYNANGGTDAPASQSKTHDISITLSSQKPTRSHEITFDANGGTVDEGSRTIGCPFTRWTTTANGTGTSYNPGDTYSAEGDATLYAQWSGATIGQLPTPIRANCQFVGWFTATSGGTQITATSTFLKNDTIYARWNYKVVYDPNHGNNADAFDDDGSLLVSIPPSQIKQHDKTLTLSSQTGSWPGKNFIGWNTKADGSGTSYSVSSSYTTNAPLVLYAQWKIPTYTVTFDANGGRWTDGTTANKLYTVNHGSSVTPPGTPSREGRDFEGWNGNYFNIVSNTTVSAIWSGSLIWIRTAAGWDRFLD